MLTPEIATFVLGDFQTNCFLVSVPGSEECWIVDCGFDPEAMFDRIDARGLRPTRLLLTHAHVDHVAGVDRARSRYPDIRVAVHEAEVEFCSDPMLNLSALMDRPVSVSRPRDVLRDGDELDLAGTTWRVVHTPGHSPGGVCFVHDASNRAIVGDTLFAEGVGRMDFPTSDPRALMRSLRTILSWPDETEIHPGHGPSTTIGRAKRENPMIRGH